MLLASSTQHSPAAAAVVKFCDVTEISEQARAAAEGSRVECAVSAGRRPQLRRSRRLLNECACVCPDRDLSADMGMDGTQAAAGAAAETAAETAAAAAKRRH